MAVGVASRQAGRVAGQPDANVVDAEWGRLLDDTASPRADDWFTPAFRLIVVAAAQVPVLRAMFPYQAANQLAFSRTTTFPFSDDLPAIFVGSTGSYFVVSRSGPDGEVLAETTDPVEASTEAGRIVTSA